MNKNNPLLIKLRKSIKLIDKYISILEYGRSHIKHQIERRDKHED